MMYRFKGRMNVFAIVTFVSAILIILPLSNILTNIFTPASSEWIHIKNYLLKEYIINTVILILLTAALSAFLGFVSAYIVTFYEFRFRKLISWLFILPLAIPSYIAAFTYADMFSYTGVIARGLRMFGYEQPIDIMNLVGASTIFSLTLYPYVFLMVKSSLQKNSRVFIENAKLLKASSTRIFLKVILPLTRPAIVAGTLLVILETLNDYGLVRYYGVRVFSYAIFDSWFRLNSPQSAMRLSGILMVIVFILIIIEKLLRGKRRYHQSVKSSPVQKIQISTQKQILVYIFTMIVLGFGFFIPVIEMFFNFLDTYYIIFEIETIYIIINTVSIVLFTSFLIVVIALMIANFARTSKSKYKTVILKITNLGYSVPGSIIAVTVVIFFVDLDHLLNPLYTILQTEKNLVLTTSITILVFAYSLRFLTIAFNSVEASYDKIGTKYTEAAYTLKTSKLKTLLTIDVPLIKEGLISAFIIVFIDVIKELPLTLILRPTNYDTLATKIYVYASDEMIQEASGPSLVLILLCSIMIYILTHRKKRGV